MLLPREILDQITSLNTQHRVLLSTINQLSRPADIPSQPVLDDLVAKIKAELVQADRAVEDLETALEIEDDAQVKREGSIHVAKISEDLNLARALFRKLLLQASKTLYQARRAQVTQILLQPPSPPPSSSTSPASQPQQQQQQQPQATLRRRVVSADPSSNDSYLLSRATDVTLALKRTHSLLEQELEKSAVQAETLEHSSQTLRQLEHSYSAFDVLLTGSRKLIRELESADKWDRWMIYGGLGVFALTCLWIIYKRVLRGPLGLVVWGVGKALGSARSEMTGAREVEGVAVKGVKVTVEIPELKDTGFGEGKEHEILWREGVMPDEVVKETVSDASLEEETPAVEAVV